MDFEGPFEKNTELVPMEYQRWNVNQEVAINPCPPEFLLNTPRNSFPPARYTHRSRSRGRQMRGKKYKQPRFDECSSHFFRQPHRQGFEQNSCCTDQNRHLDKCFHQESLMNKTISNCSWDPRDGIVGTSNFNQNEHVLVTPNYAAAPANGSKGRTYCAPFVVSETGTAERVAKMEHLYPVENQLISSEMQPYYSNEPRTFYDNAKQRKRKRQVAGETLINASKNKCCSQSNASDNPFPVFDLRTAADAAPTSSSITNAAQQGDTIKLGNCGESFLIGRESTVEHSQNELFQNLEYSCGDQQVSETVTVYANDSKSCARLNSEDVSNAFSISMLDEMFSGIEEEKPEKGKIPENITNLEKSCDLTPFLDAGSEVFETTISIANDPLTSLIQQNQILIDLLSKVINNSEIFKVSTENEVGKKNNSSFDGPDQAAPQINADLFQTSGVKIFAMDDSPFTSDGFPKYMESNEEKDTLTSNKETVTVSSSEKTDAQTSNKEAGTLSSSEETDALESVNNNYVSDLYETEDFLEKLEARDNGHDISQMSILDSDFNKNPLTSSDQFNIKEISNVETQLSILTNYVLDKSEPCPNTAKEEIDDTEGETKNAHEEDTSVVREEAKAVIGKSSNQIKTDLKNNHNEEQNLKEWKVISEPLQGYSNDKSSESSSRFLSVQTQTRSNGKRTKAAASEDSNACLKTRRLRSNSKHGVQNGNVNKNSCLESYNSLDEVCTDIYSKRKRETRKRCREEKNPKISEEESGGNSNISRSMRRKSASRKC